MSTGASLYVQGDSVLHRLAPRAKLALSAAVFVPAYAFGRPLYVGAALAAAVAALAYAGGLHNLRRVWFIVVALFVVGLVVWPGFVDPGGPVVLAAGPLVLTDVELRFALARSMRIVTFIVGGLAFVTTTANEEIVRGLRELGLPFAFCFALGTALRLFPTFLGAAGTVRQAQEARGLDLSAGNPIERLRRFVPLLVPVFMTAFRDIETRSMALEARGFDPGGERTFYDARPLTTRDWAALSVAAGVAVASVALSTLGYGVF